MLQLKLYLKERGISQGALAKAIGLARPTVNGIINHNHWPKEPKKGDLKKKMAQALHALSGEEPGTEVYKEAGAATRQPRHPDRTDKSNNNPKVNRMLLRNTFAKNHVAFA